MDGEATVVVTIVEADGNAGLIRRAIEPIPDCTARSVGRTNGAIDST